MSSIRCPRCNLTNWVDAIVCKRCGAELNGPVPADSIPQGERYAASMPSAESYYPYPPEHFGALKTGLAITSMVLGIVSVPTSFVLIGILLAPVALILGIVALSQASKKPHVYGGKGFAIAGIATGATAFLLVVPIIAAIAIPNLLAARRAANEGKAISTLRTLSSAEATYMSTYGNGSCGDLKVLAEKGFIKKDLADGFDTDYRFEVVMKPAPANCEMYATPLAKNGPRSFMIAADGILRGADKGGAKAEYSDPPIDRPDPYFRN
jgi:type IV pilus assembly protein PilA